MGVDVCFALHTEPLYPWGQATCTLAPFTVDLNMHGRQWPISNFTLHLSIPSYSPGKKSQHGV